MKTRALLFASALLAASASCAFLTIDPEPIQAQATATPASSATLLIDQSFETMWTQQGITPSVRSSDEEFLRRVYLDLVGELPTRVQSTEFIRDPGPDKRARLIDVLLADTRFGEHLADLWSVILTKRGVDAGFNSARDIFAVWLASQINANVGFDRIIEQIITATGRLSENPAVAYYLLMAEGRPRTADIAGLTIKRFAGVQIQCAQCHDHLTNPQWTQEAFGGIASFFNAMEFKYDYTTLPLDPLIVDEAPPPKRALEAYRKQGKLEVDVRQRIDEMLKYTQPQLPNDKPVKTRSVDLWRSMIHRWLTSRDNPTPREYLVNRFWSFLFGAGFVNPVDDFDAGHGAHMPQLLTLLGKDFQDSGYDLKRLYRALLNSRVYQLSSAGGPQRAQPWQLASHPVRQLAAEQLYAAFFSLTGGDALVRAFEGRTTAGVAKLRQYVDYIEDQKKKDPKGQYPNINRKALARYEKLIEPMGAKWQVRRGLASHYVTLTSDDEQIEIEGVQISVAQALELLNGDVTRRLGGSLNGTLLYDIFQESTRDDDRVSALYLAILTRQPNAAELKRALEYAAVERKTGRKDQEIYEDLFFALVSTTEFATNH